jgi:hypothetical protein
MAAAKPAADASDAAATPALLQLPAIRLPVEQRLWDEASKRKPPFYEAISNSCRAAASPRWRG